MRTSRTTTSLVDQEDSCSTITMQWLLSFLSGLVATPIVIGLAAWFGKVWAGRILEKDRAKYQTSMETILADLRTRDTKELLVHRLQFEKEFEVYKELWTAALKYAVALNSVCGPKLVAPQVSSQDLEQALEASYNRLRDTVHDNRPFYSPDVYTIAKNMLDALFGPLQIRTDLQKLAGLQGKEFNNERNQLLLEQAEIPGKFRKHLDELCLAIRRRVWSTTSSGWDRPPNPAG
ncbi:MAG: hypothetical protein MUP47_02125 [Phycisphaerae bacterium]|nr:hypothetical protein [Phycisphaerae bacterium]